MALATICRAVALLLAIFAALQVSFAAVYKVGDSAGWTTIGNVDYKQWAATKTFLVGDVIIFSYNPQFHNVMQVNHTDFRSCNASSPISSHTTGNDSITIATRGHHYFLCGVPGHCQSGQKVDINVPRIPLPPTPSPTPSSLPIHAPTPAPSSSAPLYALMGLLANLVLSMVIFIAFAAGIFS